MFSKCLGLNDLCHLLCTNSTQRSRKRNVRQYAGDGKGHLGPRHFESTCDGALQFNQGQEVWLRKAVNGKEENFMAFQGRQRIYCDQIQPNGVLPLMEKLWNSLCDPMFYETMLSTDFQKILKVFADQFTFNMTMLSPVTMIFH